MEIILAFFVGSTLRGQVRSTETVEPILILISKIWIKILMSYFTCKQLAFNDNNSFYNNKQILDSINQNFSKESTGDYVSEIFKRDSDEDQSLDE